MRAPSARLRPFVRGDYVGYTEWTGGLNRRRELPGPFVVMVIEFGPPIRIYDGGETQSFTAVRGGFVGGLCDRFAECEHDGYQCGVQINLTAIGARRLFGVPMSHLAGRIVPVRDLLPMRHRDLGEQLQELADWGDRFALLDAALADCMHGPSFRTGIVSWAVQRIEEAGGALSFSALARELGYSRKHVIAMFRDQVGIPPKLLASIVRFDRLVQHLRNGGGGTWPDLALEFGFYDQAHMARDVRRFAGAAPGQARSLISNVFAMEDNS